MKSNFKLFIIYRFTSFTTHPNDDYFCYRFEASLLQLRSQLTVVFVHDKQLLIWNKNQS